MDGFDPQAPFIGSDGVEYACLADKILNKPRASYFNQQVERYVEAGQLANLAVFRKKWAAFRQSAQYDDATAEGIVHSAFWTDFSVAAVAFFNWANGPDDPTAIASVLTGHPSPPF